MTRQWRTDAAGRDRRRRAMRCPLMLPLRMQSPTRTQLRSLYRLCRIAPIDRSANVVTLDIIASVINLGLGSETDATTSDEYPHLTLEVVCTTPWPWNFPGAMGMLPSTTPHFSLTRKEPLGKHPPATLFLSVEAAPVPGGGTVGNEIWSGRPASVSNDGINERSNVVQVV